MARNTDWQNNDLEAFEQCYGKLSEQDRELVGLRYEPGATVEGIAQTVGRSPAAVYKATGPNPHLAVGVHAPQLVGEGKAMTLSDAKFAGLAELLARMCDGQMEDSDWEASRRRWWATLTRRISIWRFLVVDSDLQWHVASRSPPLPFGPNAPEEPATGAAAAGHRPSDGFVNQAFGVSLPLATMVCGPVAAYTVVAVFFTAAVLAAWTWPGRGDHNLGPPADASAKRAGRRTRDKDCSSDRRRRRVPLARSACGRRRRRSGNRGPQVRLGRGEIDDRLQPWRSRAPRRAGSLRGRPAQQHPALAGDHRPQVRLGRGKSMVVYGVGARSDVSRGRQPTRSTRTIAAGFPSASCVFAPGNSIFPDRITTGASGASPSLRSSSNPSFACAGRVWSSWMRLPSTHCRSSRPAAVTCTSVRGRSCCNTRTAILPADSVDGRWWGFTQGDKKHFLRAYFTRGSRRRSNRKLSGPARAILGNSRRAAGPRRATDYQTGNAPAGRT